MRILRYLLSKSYREKINTEYTKEMFERSFSEQKKKQEVCKAVFSKNTSI